MARWHSCNVLQVGPAARQLWRFDARREEFALDEELKVPTGEALPSGLVGKTWQSLWQKKLNVAWLPPEQVFLRVVHLPAAGFDETLAMVELQLEKLSPLPLAQIVWSIHLMPQAADNPQTIILTIVARALVEEFLGKLEGQGFLADRLELSVLDQLLKTPPDRDGAWIYPNTVGGEHTALVAWWFGGTLQHLDLVSAPPGTHRSETLCAQLAQMAWAGELEGWLKASPRLHLVAEFDTASEWEPLLRDGLHEMVELIKPLPTAELASSTARRAATASPKVNLMPAEVATRYQQQFVDRLWMRSLGAVLAIYVAIVVIYFLVVQVQLFRVRSVENQVAELGTTYTNALKIEGRYRILKERQDLKFAALECWKATADLLPEGLKLQAMDFRDGKKLTLNGTAENGQEALIIDFNDRLRKAQFGSQPLFTKFDQLNYQKAPDGTVAWRFSCELNQGESP